MKMRFRHPSIATVGLVAGIAFGSFACPPSPPQPEAPSSPPQPKAPSSPAAASQVAGANSVKRAGWRHTRSKMTVALGSARHSAADVIVNPRTAASVHGKFAYGKISKDLQDEEVWLQIAGDNGTWIDIASGLTDSDGRVNLLIPYRYLTRYGGIPFRFLVSGDRSTAEGNVWILKRGSTAVVFDIDGTLTTGDSELIDDAFGGDIDVRKGAVDVVRHWVEAGNTPVFLTGRPYMYTASTRLWLQKHGFPPGPLATANSLSQAIPSEGGVGKFKTEWLRALVNNAGVLIQAAYGNASTDICGFARAGISPSATYIIANEQKACAGFSEVNLIAGDDYVNHVAGLRE